MMMFMTVTAKFDLILASINNSEARIFLKLKNRIFLVTFRSVRQPLSVNYQIRPSE